uniref:hypothetical protein n=1 Tax=Escherichia coli TaxID=562 RepID=UPI001BFEBA99
ILETYTKCGSRHCFQAMTSADPIHDLEDITFQDQVVPKEKRWRPELGPVHDRLDHASAIHSVYGAL